MKGKKWAKKHHMDNKGKLPARVKKKAAKKKTRKCPHCGKRY